MKFLFFLAAMLCSFAAFGATCASTGNTGGDTRVYQPCTKNVIPTINSTVDEVETDIWGPYHIAGCGDGSVSPVWSATVPAGIALDTATGRITGTPTLAGTVAATLRCTNSVGFEELAFTWDVAGDGTSTLNAIAFDHSFVLVKNTGTFVTTIFANDAIEYGRVTTGTGWNQTRYKQWDLVPTAPYTFQNFTVASLPANGTLYDVNYATHAATEITVAPTQVTDVDNLYFAPDVDWTGSTSFTVYGTDTTGASPLATISIDVYEPNLLPMPQGIPDPTWGVGGVRPWEETPPADPAGWATGPVAGYYYLDNTGACSDATDGWPGSPRCTMPATPVIAAGGKMVLVPGGSNYATACFVRWTSGDDINNPSWVIGENRLPTKPIIERSGGSVGCDHRVDGSGWRFSGIQSEDKGWAWGWDGGLGALGADDSVVFMHSVIKNYPAPTGSTMPGGAGGENYMYFNIHMEGTPAADTVNFVESDIHCITGGSSDGAWFIDITCYNVAGDGYQSNEVFSTETASFPVDQYIGRWTAHSFAENGINTKNVIGQYVFSESFMAYPSVVTWAGSSGSNGQIFLAGDDGFEQTGASLWIDNRGFGSGGAILSAENTCDAADAGGCESPTVLSRAYFIGNRVGGYYTSTINPAGFNGAILSSLPAGKGLFAFNTVSHADICFHDNSFDNGASEWMGNICINATYGFTARTLNPGGDDLIDYNAFEPGLKYSCCTGGGGSLLNEEYTGITALLAAYPSLMTNTIESSSIVLTSPERLDMTAISGPILDAVPDSVWSSALFTELVSDFPALLPVKDFDDNQYSGTVGGSENVGASQNVP